MSNNSTDELLQLRGKRVWSRATTAWWGRPWCGGLNRRSARYWWPTGRLSTWPPKPERARARLRAVAHHHRLMASPGRSDL